MKTLKLMFQFSAMRNFVLLTLVFFSSSAAADVTWQMHNLVYGPYGASGSDPRAVCEQEASTWGRFDNGYVSYFSYEPGSSSATCHVNAFNPDTNILGGNRLYLRRRGSCEGDEIFNPETGTCEIQSGKECPAAGNPIHLSGGNKYQEEIDYIGAGAYPLQFVRYYNSNLNYWRHSYSRQLLLARDDTGAVQFSRVEVGDYLLKLPVRVKYISDDGAETRFQGPQTAEGTWGVVLPSVVGDTVWIDYESISGNTEHSLRVALTISPLLTPSDGDAHLDYTGVVSKYELVNTRDETESFGADGRLTSIVKRGGLTHTIGYGSTGLTVSDDFGRTLAIEYGVVPDDSGTTPPGSMPFTLASVELPDGAVINYRSGITDIITINSGNSQTTYSRAGTTEVVYPAGNGLLARTRKYAYSLGSDRSRLISIEDERQVEYVTWNYDSAGRGAGSILAGDVDEYVVDVRQDGTTSVINPLGKESIYHFDVVRGKRRVTSVEGIATPLCDGATRATTYDDNGFVASRTDWKGNQMVTTMNDRGLPDSIIMASGSPQERTMTTTWHPSFRLPVIATTEDTVTQFTYDSVGNVLSRAVTDLEGTETRHTTWSYNAFGQVLAEDGPRTDVADVTTFTYYLCSAGYECGQLQTSTNPLGHTTTFDSYDAHGYPLSMTDSNGVVTLFTYDNRQRLTSLTVDSSTTNFVYDEAGNLTRTTLADGTFTEYVWDDANRLVALADSQGNRIDWVLDNAGNRTQETLKDPQDTIKKSLQRSFDELSRLIDVLPHHGGNTQYGYDTNSNLTSMTDASSRETLRAYDALDRLTSIRDALLGSTQFAYDTQDNITRVTDPEGLVTQYTYNRFGDQLTLNSPDTGLTQYSYDAAGNRLTMTDARNVTVSYSYDALNRLTNVIYPDAALNITYSYDQGVNGVGRLTSITDGSGSTSYSYDARGNVTSLIQTVAGQSYTQTYSYNAADRLTSMQTPGGRVISYNYDTSGRITQVSSEQDGQTEVLANNIARLPFGPMSSMTLGNGMPKTRSYDLDYRVQNITDGGILTRNYGYSPVDNITAITDSINPALSQLFTYDDLDRLDFATGNYGDLSYSYDGVGNRLSLTEDIGGNTQTQSYVYEASSHRLSEITGERAFQYDAVGNTLDNGLATFAYNDRNRMSETNSSSGITTYDHNALGQRVRKANGATETHFLFDLSGRLIAEADGSGVISVEYAYLDGEPLVMWRDDNAPSVPGEITPIAPVGSTDSATPTFEWADEGTTTTYRLLVFDRSVGAFVHNEDYLASAVCVNAVCSVTPPTLTLNFDVNHRWRIRAQNEQGWNDVSPPVYFDYIDAPPGVVTPIAPLVSTTTATPAYEWQDLGNVTDYRLIVVDRVLGTQVHNVLYTAADICSAGVCSVVPNGVTLNFSANHAWRLRAKNSGGWNDVSEPFLFDYVDTPPGAITPLSPLGSTATATPAYEWQDLGNVTDYRLIVVDRALGTQVHNALYTAADICAAGTCSVMPEGVSLIFHVNHVWRIRARNSGGWNDISEPHLFDYVDVPPIDITPIGPMGSISTTTPTFEWAAIDNADEYQLIVFDRMVGAQVHNERHFVGDVCTATDCAITPSELVMNIDDNHVWRVRAGNSGGWGNWTPNQSFDVTGGQ